MKESATFSGWLVIGNCLLMRRDIEGTFLKMVYVRSVMGRVKILSMCCQIVLQLSMFGIVWCLEILLLFFMLGFEDWILCNLKSQGEFSDDIAWPLIFGVAC